METTSVLRKGTVPSGHIGSAWEWNYWIGLEKDISRYRFFIFYFWSWIFDKSSKFWAASWKNESNLLIISFGSRSACAQTTIFSQPSGIQTKIEQHFGGFFHQIKERQPIGFYANHDPNKQEVGFIFAWSGSELWSLFKCSRMKLKNQKPIAVDVLFKAYPMVPLSCTVDPIWPDDTFKVTGCRRPDLLLQYLRKTGST